jgi:hypothetical protein
VDKLPSFDAGEAPRRSTSSLGARTMSAILTPALFDAGAKCVVFGVLPIVGASILFQYVRACMRSGIVWIYRRGGDFTLYRRIDGPLKFWVALSLKSLSLFVLCAVPFCLFIVFFLPQLLSVVRTGGNP